MNFYGIFVFVSLCILILIVVQSINILIRKGISPGAKTNKKAVSLLLYPVFLLIVFAWIFEIARNTFQLPISILPKELSIQLFNSMILRIAGIIIVILSLFFMKVTLAHFGNSLRFGHDENNAGKLITTGIFSVSRNPFFLSLDIYFYGIALILPSLFFIGFTILAITSIHFFILKEEKFMLKVYGSEYEEYRKRVKRYIKLKSN